MSGAVRRLVVGSVLFTLCATLASAEVGWEDSAFLQLCHATLGVPHGPGFPLYVVLGRVWVWPFGDASALGSNLLSALAFAVAGVVLLELLLLLGSGSEAEPPRTLRSWKLAGAVAVVLGWATLPFHRAQAARAEVYPLTLLLVLLTGYLALRSRDTGGQRSWSFACAAAWCWGLGMAVHPLIVAAGATPWLAPVVWRWRHRAITLSVLALAPLTLYLFPILRGRIEGVWAWGDFTSLSSLLDYFTRRSAWAAVSTPDGGWLENLAGWGFGFSDLLPAGLWIPTLWGLWLLRKQRTLFASLAGLFILVLWAAPYDPANLDLFGYVLPAVALLTVATGVVVMRVLSFLCLQMQGLSGRSRFALGFFLVSLGASWPAVSLVSAAEAGRNKSSAGDVARRIGDSLPHGATLFVTEDNLLGILEYQARTQHFRPDLRVVALGALRYPFYRRAQAGRLPPEWSAGHEFQETWNDARWRTEIRSLFALQRPGDAWFCQYDRLPGLTAEQCTPHGYVAQLSGPGNEAAWDTTLSFWKGRVQQGPQDGPAGEALARWIFNFGALALDRGYAATGWDAMQLAVLQSPNDPEIYYLLGRAFQRAGRLTESQTMLAAALEIAPYRRRYRAAVESLTPTLAVQP
jgi:hypothetical protein